jgi:thiol-disulfide isomerase/thioredoxin
MAPADEQQSAPSTPQASTPLLGRQARLAVGTLAICGLAALFWPRGSGEHAPGGLMFDAAGRSATIGSRLAPVSLVHFWATWCAPCLTEVPALQRLAADLSSERDFGVVLVAVADDRERVRGLLGEASEDVLFDANWEAAHRYGTKQLPETYLVVNGKVVQKWVGPTDWGDPAVRRAITTHLPGGTEQRAAR